MKKTCALILMTTLIPLAALAQQPKAGDVTQVDGTANVTRNNATTALKPTTSVADPKAPVFQKDTIKTGEQSLVKMLLGGKALVTIREHSSVTITEDVNKVVVDMTSGKARFATLGLSPNQSIEVRMPNAIASVRGSVAFTEIVGTTEHVDCESGNVSAGLRGAPLTPIPPGQGQTFIGTTAGSLRPIRPGITAGWEGKKQAGQKQKPDASGVSTDLGALGGAQGEALPGAGGASDSRIIPGNPRGGYISKP